MAIIDQDDLDDLKLLMKDFPNVAITSRVGNLIEAVEVLTKALKLEKTIYEAKGITLSTASYALDQVWGPNE